MEIDLDGTEASDISLDYSDPLEILEALEEAGIDLREWEEATTA
jgi:hypothetical protein